MKGARPITTNEMKALLAAATDPRLRALVAVLCYTGARLHEALALTWEDVCQGAAARRQIRLKKRATKGKREGRIVPVNADLARELERYQEVQLGQLGFLFPSLVLFPGEGTGAWSRSAATRAFGELAYQARLEGVSTHSCRKWCANELARRGARVQDIAEILGHASIATTQEYLEEAPAGRLQAAMDALADLEVPHG